MYREIRSPAPTKIRVRMEQRQAKYDPDWYHTPHRKVALKDFVARRLAEVIRREKPNIGGTGKAVSSPSTLQDRRFWTRTTVVVTPEYVEARISIGLPASGRRILGQKAARLLLEVIPSIVAKSLPKTALDIDQLEEHLKLSDNQFAIRQYMAQKGWIVFVANGSVLPRESGISDRPLTGDRVVRFNLLRHWSSPSLFPTEIR